MIDSFHYTVYGSYGRGLPRDLDGYVHLTAAAWLAAPVDTAGEPMTPEQAETLAEQARSATREAEAAVAARRESEPTREQVAALQDEAGTAGDDAMVSICAAALDGEPVALAEVARCLREAAAQRDE
jgi:hypothetical protein